MVQTHADDLMKGLVGRRYSMQRFIVVSALVFMSLISQSAWSETLVDKAKNDSSVEMGDDEPAMQKAMQQARAGLDDFLKKVGAPPRDTEEFSVKVRVSDGGNEEFLWVSDLKGQGELWSGRINNIPMIRSVKKGQSYSFAKSEIVDWTYRDKAKKKIMGNFTTCALLTKEPPSVAETLRKEYGLECLP